jgi:hypothetical protein
VPVPSPFNYHAVARLPAPLCDNAGTVTTDVFG